MRFTFKAILKIRFKGLSKKLTSLRKKVIATPYLPPFGTFIIVQ